MSNTNTALIVPTNHINAPGPTLGEIADRYEEKSVTCPECKGSGEREYQVTRLTNFFDPYNYQTGPCDECQGEGYVTIEVCPLCGRQEADCVRTCKPAVCCGRHPLNCECPDGALLYHKVYGVPGYIAPMSLKRVEAAIKDAYKKAPSGSWIETWYFDALLAAIFIERDAETQEARVA